MDSPPPLRHSPWLVACLWLLAVAGVVGAAYWYQHDFEEQHVHGQVQAQLSAVADLKALDLYRYREDQLHTALTVHRNVAFSELVERALSGDAKSEARVLEWLEKFVGGLAFDRVRVFDALGGLRYVLPRQVPRPSEPLLDCMREAERSGQVQFADFFRNNVDGRIYLAIAVPVLAAPEFRRVVGAVTFHIDPEQFLYPQIQRWPTPSETAETLLVRREGDEVVYLNGVRYRPDAALRLRIPLRGAEKLPAAMAVRGRTGIVQGVDYRGRPVLAALRKIPNSPWFLVARVDLEEVYAPVRERFWMVIVLSGALLLAGSAAAAWLWRVEQARALERSLAVSQKLSESDQRFRVLFEHTAQGVSLNELVYSETGQAVDFRILDANPAFEKQTGIAMERARGALASAIFGDLPHLEKFERAAQTGETIVFEEFFPALNRHLRISAMSPKPGFFNTLVEDVTARIEWEEELRRKNAEMERFTYTVSHDLRGPLVTIQTFVGFLDQDLAANDSSRVVMDLVYLQDASAKMGRLIDHLADMSRVGRIVNPATPISLADLVGEVLTSLAGQLLEKRIDVRMGLLDVMLYADRVRVSEIWQNLIENAVKYIGEQAAPVIEIGVEGSGPEAVFFVRDNGIGIEPQYLDRVFSLFEKLDPKSAGTGFGLALVRRIVELYKGRIWAESDGLGHGACFRFTLPQAIDQRAERKG